MSSNAGQGQAQGRDICQRAGEYALRSIQLYRVLVSNRDGVGLVIGKQFLRAATSIGANLIEAQSGESRKDFVHKLSIAQKEARESKYWLTLILRGKILAADLVSPLYEETNQLIAILTRIIVSTKQNTPRKKSNS